jgi:hypothetical protein
MFDGSREALPRHGSFCAGIESKGLAAENTDFRQFPVLEVMDLFNPEVPNECVIQVGPSKLPRDTVNIRLWRPGLATYHRN